MPEILDYGINDLISCIEDLRFDDVTKTEYYYETLKLLQSFATDVENLKKRMEANLNGYADEPESQNWNFWQGHVRAIDMIQKGEE